MTSPRRRKLPTYFVSASHRKRGRLIDGEPGWTPYGTQHAREVGSQFTACGVPAMGWPYFWEQAFPSPSTATCRACMVVLSRKRLDEVEISTESERRYA